MIQESITLMILGMSTVFTFLVILMFSVKAMGYVLQRSFPEPLATIAPNRPLAPVPNVANQDAVVAAITTAVAMHRQQKSS